MCRLLRRLGCHRRGMWRGVCPCRGSGNRGSGGSCGDRGGGVGGGCSSKHSLAVSGCGSHACIEDCREGGGGGSPRASCGHPAEERVEAEAEEEEEEHLPLLPNLAASWCLAPELVPGVAAVYRSSISRTASRAGASSPPVLLSWQQYYRARGLPAASPAALVLHWVLTLYIGIMTADDLAQGGLLEQGGQQRGQQRGRQGKLLASQRRDRQERGGEKRPCVAEETEEIKNPLHILFLGPRKELLALPALQELRELLPASIATIWVHFVGPDVPSAWHGLEASLPSRATLHPPPVLLPLGVQPSAVRSDLSAGREGPAPVSSEGAAPAADGRSEGVVIAPFVSHSGGCLIGDRGINGDGDGDDEEDGEDMLCWREWMQRVRCGQRLSSGSGSGESEDEEEDGASSWAGQGAGGSVDPATSPAPASLPAPASTSAPASLPAPASTSAPSSTPAPAALPALESLPSEQPQLRMSFWQAHLHEIYPDLARRYGLGPHNTVAYAPNAGLAAYPSWLPTMRLLLHPGARDEAMARTGAREEAEAGTTGAKAGSGSGDGGAAQDGGGGGINGEWGVGKEPSHGPLDGGAADLTCSDEACRSAARPSLQRYGLANELGDGPEDMLNRWNGLDDDNCDDGGQDGRCLKQHGHGRAGSAAIACIVTDYCQEALYRGRVSVWAVSGGGGSVHLGYAGRNLWIGGGWGWGLCRWLWGGKIRGSVPWGGCALEGGGSSVWGSPVNLNHGCVDHENPQLRIIE